MNNLVMLKKLIEEKDLIVHRWLLIYYNKLNLTEIDMMVILHLLNFALEGINFPTIKQIKNRMTIGEDVVVKSLQKLVKNGFMKIEEINDNNLIAEAYNLEPLYEKFLLTIISEYQSEKMINEQEINIYKLFEQEFARPLSPMEYEIINKWIDIDKLPNSLIQHALKEAVYLGKVNFRYIDRILFEWNKNNILTVEDAVNYSQKFLNKYKKENKGKGVMPSIYNWLEDDKNIT